MIGQIESYDPDKQTGVIRSESALFTFHLEDWAASVPPDVDDDVNFDAEGTSANNIKLVGAYLEPLKAVKYKYLAAVLALLLGLTGAHRFYLGFYRLGFIQLALGTILIVAGAPGFAWLWGFIEGVLIFGGQIYLDAKGRPLK